MTLTRKMFSRVQDAPKLLYSTKVISAKSNGKNQVARIKWREFLKLALPRISGSLAYLFNIAIETSAFPDSWKIARVTPIFKEGEKCERSNYRPISVLPVIQDFLKSLSLTSCTST